MTKNNSADCLVCGESYLLDARLLDYCGTCCAHEIRHHSPEGCLPECRFCAPGGCSDCGAYVAPDAECSNCQRGPRAARELEITWTERHPATPRAERFNAYVRDLTRVPSYLASGLGPSPAAAITDALELAAAVQLEEAADADLIERRRALDLCNECGERRATLELLESGALRCATCDALDPRPETVRLLEERAADVGPSGCSDYDEACDATVTAEQARREIERHDCPGDCTAHGENGHATAWSAFRCDAGERATYRGNEVLDWLGY